MVSDRKSYSLPPNTVVGVQAYSLHRNEDIYGDRPDEVLPGVPVRWEMASAGDAISDYKGYKHGSSLVLVLEPREQVI